MQSHNSLRYEIDLESGVCPRCHNNWLFDGQKACTECRERRAGLRQVRRSNGECSTCGEKLPDGYRWRMCEDCRRQARVARRRYVKKHSAKSQKHQWRRVLVQCPFCLARRAVPAGYKQDVTGARRGHDSHAMACTKCGRAWVTVEHYLKHQDISSFQRPLKLQEKNETQQHTMEGGD